MKPYCNIICFSADTLVETPLGEYPISSVEPGMEVISYDIRSSNVDFDMVKNVVCSSHDRCAIVTLDSGTRIKMTLDHPIYVVDKGWCAIDIEKPIYGVSVKNLCVGDTLVCYPNKILSNARIVSIEIITCSEVFYCLSTLNTHTFFANGIVAHDIDIDLFYNQNPETTK